MVVVLIPRRFPTWARWSEAKRQFIRSQLRQRYPRALVVERGAEVPYWVTGPNRAAAEHGDWIIIRFPGKAMPHQAMDQVVSDLHEIDQRWFLVYRFSKLTRRGARISREFERTAKEAHGSSMRAQETSTLDTTAEKA